MMSCRLLWRRDSLTWISASFWFCRGVSHFWLGWDFFQKFVEEVGRLKKSDQKVLFTVQTNGWSVDERWADFFKKHEFLVGLSLDGVRKSHDSNRLGPCGEGTFEKVFASACLLRDAGIPLNILCVLNRQTTERIEAIYRFLMRKGFFPAAVYSLPGPTGFIGSVNFTGLGRCFGKSG